MLSNTRIEPPIETTTAGDHLLLGIAQGTFLVVLRGTNDVLRTVKLSILLVPGSKRNLFSSSAAAQKRVETIIEKSGSFLDLGPFSVQLTRFDNIDHLDLANAK